MSTENNKSIRDLIFDSYKEEIKSKNSFNFNRNKAEKKARQKSMLLDIIFGLLLLAMCILLMSIAYPKTGLSTSKIEKQKVHEMIIEKAPTINLSQLAKVFASIETVGISQLLSIKNKAIIN